MMQSAAPQMVVRQIAGALAESAREQGGPIDVALDPPELERVRLSLVDVHGSLTLSIVADRPETADLMRRHLSLLAQEFARSGIDPPSVDISGGGRGDRPPNTPAPHSQAHATEHEIVGAAAAPVVSCGGGGNRDGLDLRL
jgi:flagellar hook-length control protein FliK